jgi:hypothetical protein
MERDPLAFARSQGLPRGDGAAFLRYRNGLLRYRGYVQGRLTEPILGVYPVTAAFLETRGAWEACLGTFLASRAVRSPFHRDIAPSFAAWLADSGWGRRRWPFLLQLAHGEVLRALVARQAPLPEPGGLRMAPGPADRIVLDPSAHAVTYDWRVHLATPEAPEPARGRVHLLFHRDGRGETALRELTPATAHLVVQGQARPIGAVLRELGLEDAGEALALLEGLRAEGAILGFRS